MRRYLYIGELARYFNLTYDAMKYRLLKYQVPIMGVSDKKVSVDHLDLVIKHLL